MTAPGNDLLLTVLLVAFTTCTGYAAGRIHQWYRTALDRDQAYRDGYDTATRSLFSLAARIVRPRRSDKSAVRGTATVTSILEAPSNAVRAGDADIPVAGTMNGMLDQSGRHTAPDELVTGPTYRLAPDRVARARVPGARTPEFDLGTVRNSATDPDATVETAAANHDEHLDRKTSRMRIVPKPRAS